MVRLALLVALLLAAIPAAAKPLRVAVISDLNGSYGSTDYSSAVSGAVSRIIELQPDLVISTGDMVAGQRRNPHLSAAEIDAMWAVFRTEVAAPLAAAGIPLIATPGNHDASAYSGFEAERAAYARVWASPPAGVEMVDDDGWPFRYAVALDDALFVSLDVTTIGTLDLDQTAWLEALVGREAGRQAIVAFSHLPIWPFAVGRETETAGGEALASLFSAVGVDAHLTGHHHAFYPGVYDGVLYVAQACLGGGPRRLVGDALRAPKAFTLLEIAEDGAITESALTGPDFATPIDLETLPSGIPTAWGVLIRRDLAP
jgi:3',5'-cyclic AMP phosphodiesterase CpdA